jgi:hypothetical protein
MPPPLPPGFEPETPQRSLPPLPPGFEHETSARPDTRYEEEKEPRDPKNPNMAWIDIPGLGRAAKGAAKTVTGLGAGAAEAFGAGDTSLAKTAKKWATAPATSIAEEEGRFLPYFLQPRLGLGALADRMVVGGLVGGFTPTESGTPESHEENAKWGAGMSAALGSMGLPASAIRNSPMLRRLIGHAINGAIGEALTKAFGYGHMGLVYAMHRGGPGHVIAKRLPDLMQAGSKIPGGVAGRTAAELDDAR